MLTEDQIRASVIIIHTEVRKIPDAQDALTVLMLSLGELLGAIIPRPILRDTVKQVADMLYEVALKTEPY